LLVALAVIWAPTSARNAPRFDPLGASSAALRARLVPDTVCRQRAQYGLGIGALHHDTDVIAWVAPRKDMGALELPGKMTAWPETRS
jgi:hypothetical protein